VQIKKLVIMQRFPASVTLSISYLNIFLCFLFSDTFNSLRRSQTKFRTQTKQHAKLLIMF